MDNSYRGGTDQGAGAAKPEDKGVEKNEKWYRDYALWVASKYNFLIPQFAKYGHLDDRRYMGISERWVNRILESEAYIKLEQDDKLFEFMGNDEQNNPLPTKFIKDSTPYTIFKHVWGNLRRNCIKLPDTVYANAITNQALASKQLGMNLAKMKIDHIEEFAELEEAGVEFKPMGQDFQNHKEVEDYGKSMQDGLATFFTAFAKDFLYSQHWEEKCSKMAEYVIPSYFGRVELVPHEQDIEWIVHRPAQCIWDNSYDDELGRRQRLQGLVESYSIPQLLAIPKYKWSDKEIKKLQAMATAAPDDAATIINLNDLGGGNVVWWNMLNKTPSVSVVRAYWISWDDENEIETWYQCDIIGGDIVKNCKPCDNITYNKDGTMNPPLIDFIPEMTYGCNSSIIWKMKQISGKITGINAKIDALIARAKGKVPFIFGNKIPEGTTQSSLLRMVASGLVYLKGVDIDDIKNDPNNKDSLMQVMDLTAAVHDIQVMRNEVMYWENKMREMASTPLVQLGAQTEVIGKSVQEQTIEQSTLGMLPLYHGFTLWVNEILNRASQIKKNLITAAKSHDEYTLQVSPNQFEYFKVTEDVSLVELQIYLSQQDMVDEADKKYIQSLAERESSIPGSFFNTLDAIELLSFSTKTEMKNYLRYAKQKWDAEQERIRQEQLEMQAMQQEQNNATQEQIAETQAEATLANTALSGQEKLKQEAFKAAMQEGAEAPQ